MDRSFDAANDIVAELDRQSMSTKRPITRAMATTVMAKGAPLTICAQEV
jgi:hypothetical protein